VKASLWIPGVLPGLNDLLAAAKGAGGTGRGYARLKRQWGTHVWACARNAGLHRTPFVGPVRMAFKWVERDRRRDPDNLCAGGRKIVNDSLVKAGVLANDGWRHIHSWSDTWRVDPKNPGVRVTIESADLDSETEE